MGDMQVRSLKIIARAKGWDPDKIYDPKAKKYVEDIGHQDGTFAIFTNQGVTDMPEKAPMDWPDGYDGAAGFTEKVT
jgi:hypothetical protein